MLKVTAPIVLKKDKKERKNSKPKKLFKGDHNPAAVAVISQTYVKTKNPGKNATWKKCLLEKMPPGKMPPGKKCLPIFWRLGKNASQEKFKVGYQPPDCGMTVSGIFSRRQFFWEAFFPCTENK